MADGKAPRIERIYLQFLATKIKLIRIKEELKITDEDYDVIMETFGNDKSLPVKYARYNAIVDTMKSFVKLSKWLHENFDAVQPLVEKYFEYGEEEFIKAYRELKRKETA